MCLRTALLGCFDNTGRGNSGAEHLIRSLAGYNGPASVGSFAAEAGQFEEAGFATVLCGPGAIEQAHKADEFIEKDEIERGANFMLRLADYLSKP